MPKKKATKRVKRTINVISGKRGQVRYTEQQQKEAAEDVILHGDKVAAVARERGCSPISINSWIKKFEKEIRKEHHQAGHTAHAKETHVEHHASAEHPKAHHEPEHPKPVAPKPKPERKESASAVGIKITSRSGVVVEFPAGTDMNAVSSMVKNLEDF